VNEMNKEKAIKRGHNGQEETHVPIKGELHAFNPQ